MIFSRTARETDTIDLNIQERLINYLQSPSSLDNYNTSIFKFWEYSLLLKLIEEYKLQNDYILNIVVDKKDMVLESLAKLNNIKIDQISYQRFLKLPIKINRYGIVCAFGILEHSTNEYYLVDKISIHIKLNGYLMVTTDGSSTPSKREMDVNDLISISFFLEQNGYDFCSDDELNMVYYTEKSNLHSLVMKRLGN
jgi:hypothetical protein